MELIKCCIGMVTRSCSAMECIGRYGRCNPINPTLLAPRRECLNRLGHCRRFIVMVSYISSISNAYFLPLFLMPPLAKGPLPAAFWAISARALASVVHQSPSTRKGRAGSDRKALPAFCFSRNAISLSSMSSSPFCCFFGAFRGFTLPPAKNVSLNPG